MPAPDLTSPRRAWVVPAAIVVVAFALVLLVLQRDRAGVVGSATGTVTDGPAATVVEPAAPDELDMARRDPADPLAAGPVDAPVVLVAYSDYQCPFCALWAEQTEAAMMEYVDAGDLRIEWRDVNVYGADSERASRAAYAAGLQDRFWEYHRALFADGEKRPPEELSEEALVALAGELGLDVAAFTADLGSPEVVAAVTANADEGLGIGAYSTPSFIIGGRPVVGAQPTDVFVDAVEDALARAEG